MINPINSTHFSDPSSQAPAPKLDHPARAPQQTVKSGTVSPDQVTLKSAGQGDSDNK
jgi:hypothetical protein